MDGQPKMGKVVNLRRNPAYRPDLAALARDQVAAGRRKLGLTQKEFAELLSPLLGWSPTADIVEGWETSAVPPGDVILAIGMATQSSDQNVLSVALTSDAERVVDLLGGVVGDLNRVLGAPDVVQAYETRGMITRSQWNGIIENSKQHIWLYGMAELGYALDDAYPNCFKRPQQAAAASGFFCWIPTTPAPQISTSMKAIRWVPLAHVSVPPIPGFGRCRPGATDKWRSGSTTPRPQ